MIGGIVDQQQRRQPERAPQGPTQPIPDSVGGGELEAARNRLEELTGEQDQWAVAATLLTEKQILSPTQEQSRTFVEQIVQRGGE